MKAKGKMLLGMAALTVGATAAIGGTFAYFSDAATSTSKFTDGKVVLRPHEPYIEQFNLAHFKPGDKLVATQANQSPAITLNNQGDLPFNVFMTFDSNAQNEDGTASDLDSKIVVNSLGFGGVDLLTSHKTAWDTNADGKVSLAELKAGTTGDATVNGNVISGVGMNIGDLTQSGSGTSIKTLTFEMEFVDDGTAQNQYQGDISNVKYKFTALQKDGTTWDSTNLSNHTSPHTGGGTWDNN